MAQMFLCHASEDKPQVREVYRRLKEAGFEPWLDEEELLPGQLWEQEIPKVLKSSDFILVFFSQNSVAKRGYVQREMRLALDAWEEIPEGMIHAIPMRLDQCEIPERFQQFQWVDLFTERGFEKIVRTIRQGLSQRQPPVRDSARGTRTRSGILARGLSQRQQPARSDEDINIQFEEDVSYDSKRKVVWFQAGVNAETIHCAITMEALKDHFEAIEESAVHSFHYNRERIVQLASQLIRDSRFEDDGTVMIGSTDVV